MYDYSSILSKETNKELVQSFNREVGNPGWVITRSYYLRALREEFYGRNIDFSKAINDSGGFKLSKKVRLDNNKLVLI